MSDDSFTETSSKSWFSRIGSALAGVVVGLALFVGSFLLLGWNEGRAIHRAKTLDVGAGQVISISPGSVLAENDRKLVYLTGAAEAPGPVTDGVFGITVDALKLQRGVEMYQWKEDSKSETRKKLGGGEETTTTYSYSKDWSPSLIESAKFKNPSGHTNPDAMPFVTETFTAEGIHVGKFGLPRSLTARIRNFVSRPVTEAEAKAAAKNRREKVQPTADGRLYVGEDPQSPAVGDLRVAFQMAPSGPVSIIAGQTGNTLEPFAVKKLGTIELLESGTVSAEIMFQKEKQSNVTLTWILRLAGFLLMLFGLMMVCNLFSVLASIVPFFGDIVGLGTGVLAFAIALPLTLVTIALAWLAYRPLIGIPLLLAAVGSIAFTIMKLAGSRKNAPAAS
ncbi:MAG: TMEM43 family protein [Verrucomicrobiota bacterium]